jgi:hypothetical protein
MVAKVVLVFVIGGAFLQNKPAESPMRYIDPAAYEVYSAILPREWSWRANKGNYPLVITSETIGENMCLFPAEESKAALDPAIADYKKVNSKIWVLQPKLRIEKPYQLVPRKAIRGMFSDNKNNSWQMFYEKYPHSGGYIWFSAVGFNADRTIAVVSTGHSCEMLCGGGGFAVLHKEDGNWKEFKWKGSSCGWAS